MTRREPDLAEPGQAKNPAPEEITEALEGLPFIIVGIGASAGGLEALEAFFTNIPPDIGAGFVVITHMDPEHRSLLPEILQRSTTMPVVQIEHGMKVQPNTVYVIPPNTDLAIQDGTLILEEPALPRGGRLPIDHFFRRLAEDQDSRAVGILLSGMGHDGVLGLRALKERLGMVMVQDPITAEFPSMPQSVVVSGLADSIAPADKLPELLVDYVQSYQSIREARGEKMRYERARSKILTLIRSRTGEDYSTFKESRIRGRIERRMGLHQIKDSDEYVRYVQEHLEELDSLAQEIPSGPNWFFQNPEVWAILRERALPELIRTKPSGSTLRVWVAGCATGEQAYSMAIELEEAIEASGRRATSSLNLRHRHRPGKIAEARNGVYIANIEMDVSPERLERFFTKRDSTYQVRLEIREKIIFAQHNILNHPLFLHLDLLDARGLLLSMSPEGVQEIVSLFQGALAPGESSYSASITLLQNRLRILNPGYDLEDYRRLPRPEGGESR